MASLKIGDTKREEFIVKTAPQRRLDNEREVLRSFSGRPYIRQLVDEVADPPCLVLEFLDDNLLDASNAKKLDKTDIKFVARNILEALKDFHEADFVHTDAKPDNILVNYSNGPARFSKVQIGDCGDTYRVGPDADINENGHIIGAAIFRSPEAMLNLRWRTATDIWSFGAISPASEEYAAQVLINQVSFFEPVPLKYQEIADEDRLHILAVVINHVKDTQKPKPFAMAEDPELSLADKDFLCRIMKFDPSDKPTARELLEDDWFMDS